MDKKINIRDDQLLYDWRPNKDKEDLTQSLAKKTEYERGQLPELLSREDLKIRWQMNSRQSVHNIASKNDFPQPILVFNHGKTPLYLATEIKIYEINHPWIITPENRASYSEWIFQNVIADDPNSWLQK